MNSFVAFLNRMDKSAWRAVLVSLGLFGLVAVILVVGRTVLLAGEDSPLTHMQDWLVALRDSPFGLPALIIIFCAAAFLGAPQFALIAAAVVAFGPVRGFAYSWVATMCSAALTFWIGRWMGEGVLRRYGGSLVNHMSAFVGRNDFLASLVVRNVPTAPFIVVNMAFGVSQAIFWRYLAGAAIGVLPKTALVAFGGGAISAALGGAHWQAIAAMVVCLGIWIGGMLFARARMRRSKDGASDAVEG